MSEHVLLSTVGVSDYEQTHFVLDDDRETRAALSPVALTRLLDVDVVLLAHTAEVRTDTSYLERVRTSCEEQDVEVTFVEVPLVRGRADVDRLLSRVMRGLDDANARTVTLDITHAFRSLQLALYTAVVQLDALDVVDVDALYYTEDAGAGGTTQVLDLTYLYTLMEWHHALRSFQRAGTLGPLHQLLETKRNRIYREDGQDPQLVELETALNSVSSYVDAGLPLEAGAAANHAVETLETLNDGDFIGPEGAFLDPLAERLQDFVVDDDVTASEKSQIDLTVSELKRQRDLVRFFLQSGRGWIALECARELFLNRLLYERHGSDADWLDHDVRHEIRGDLTELARKYRSSDEDPPDAIRVWWSLSQYRNMHAHAGFDPNKTPTGDSVRPVIETFCDLLNDDASWTRLIELT